MKINQIYYKDLNETMYEYSHPSGLKAYFIPKQGYSKKYAIFGANFGSIHNAFRLDGEEMTKVPDGIAHFLEHKLFETEDGSVMESFSKLGAQPNAFTNFSQTAYLFSCTDGFIENFKLLLRFVQKPFLTEESIEKEKGIIGQEIKMYDDNPGWRSFFNLLGAMYYEHPVKIDIAGTIDSIAQIDKDILMKCYNTFYHPSNMAIFICGDLDVKAVFSILDECLLNKGPSPKVTVTLPEEGKSIVKPIVEIAMDVSMPLFQMGFKDSIHGLQGKDFLKREIGIKILLEMMLGKSSELYAKLYNEGWINHSFDYDFVLEKTYGHSIIGGESKDPFKVKTLIEEHIEMIEKNGLNMGDFERIRRSMKGKFLRRLNSVERICQSCMGLYFKDANIFDYFEAYDTITFENVQELFTEHFDVKKLAISIVRPLKGEQ